MSTGQKSNIHVNWEAYETQLAEGKGHVKFGLGVGAFGALSLAVIGTTCPLCFVVAPAMVGVGAWKARRAKIALKERDENTHAENLPEDPRHPPEDPRDGNL